MRRLPTSRSVTRLAQVAGLTALLAISGQAFAQATGIATTKHNLGTTGTGAKHVTTGTDEICVFCHTPHGSNTGVTAPLWNKGTPAGVTYNVYSTSNSTTIDGQTVAVGSVSLACLSCHDGSQAMDNMINAPGSGGYNPAGISAGYTWTGGVGTNNSIGAGIANIGGLNGTGGTADLTNDHPIGIAYCGGGPNAATPATACRDPDFKVPTNDTINGTLVFWVETGAAGSGRQKTDMILYNRSEFTGGSGPSVECASCHDPHSTNSTFLRVQNTGSAVCLACHVK